MVTSLKANVNALPQASLAMAWVNEGVAGQFMVVAPGKAAITGAVLSTTLMVCDLVEAFPQISVAIQVLVTLYDPAHNPRVVTSAEVSVNGFPQASAADATAKTGVAGQLIVVGEGKEAITGAVRSCT